MKTIKISAIIIIIFCILYSCNKKSSQNQDYNSINEVVISNESSNEIKASSFIDNYKIIQLSTSSDNLIFQISKVQYLNEKIYILDKPANCIYVFNNNGSFLKKLNKIGSGPGEYIQITDFYIDENNLLHVMDFNQNVILRYNDDFEYLNKTNFTSHGSKFIYHDNVYWSYNEPIFKKPDYQFSSFTKDGKVLSNFLARNSTKHDYVWSGVNAFALNGRDNYLSPPYNDTIYSIKNNNIKPEFVINFKGRRFPKDKNINDYDINSLDFPFFIKRNFYKSNKYLIVDYLVKRNRWFCVHDIETKITKYGLIENDLIKNFRFFPRWGNDNFLIEELGPEILLAHFKSSPQFEKFINGKEDDNPLIIIYEVRK